MSREGATVTLSSKVLGVIIAACLGVGSGGSFIATRAAAAASEAAIAAPEYAKASALAEMTTRVAVTEVQNREINRRLDSIESKLDALLARRH